ncbi:MAG: dihydrofolate reductase [Bacteroidetes bacterium]|nr:dihydrofolate reductase [Bacteroidota bacterium]
MAIISIIVAVDQQNAIGRQNNLLCHLPADLKYFKSITDGHTIIMGRRTFESLPKGALPNRRNIVITRNKDLQWANVEACVSLKEALALTNGESELFIIGGGSVYRDAITFADKLYVTEIQNSFERADTHFPEIDKDIWRLISEEKHSADDKNRFDYHFLIYERI